jgi:hypothetical protein
MLDLKGALNWVRGVTDGRFKMSGNKSFFLREDLLLFLQDLNKRLQ